MTILTAKSGEKKDEEWSGPPPEVATEDMPMKEPMPVWEDRENPPPLPLIAVTAARRRSSTKTNLCVLLTTLIVLLAGVIGGILIYKYFQERTFTGVCGVGYLEEYGHSEPQTGLFEEQVEIDRSYQRYEKFQVPEFGDVEEATVLHDFESNYTAIVDKDDFLCYVLPLDRSAVKPPRDLIDLIGKLRTGYYFPDTQLVKENYRVLQPMIENLSPYGYYVWRQCQNYRTYRLLKVNSLKEPIAMVKRSAPCATHKYMFNDGRMYEFKIQDC